MLFKNRIIRNWLSQGIYTRLFIPLLLLIMGVAVARYTLFIQTETRNAEQEARSSLQEVARHLVPELRAASAGKLDLADSELLQQELQANPGLSLLIWHDGRHEYRAESAPPERSRVPDWFSRRLALPQQQLLQQVELADGRQASLQLNSATAAAVARIWYKMLLQLKISLVLVCCLYGLLVLLLNLNARAIFRLSSAAGRFKAGDYAVRLPVSGTREAQQLALTFNDMADEVERLLSSLKHSQNEQSEQLHFTMQLLTALPTPIFFEDNQGICRGVNAAWTQLTGLNSRQALGRPLREALPELAELAPLALDAEYDSAAVTEIRLACDGHQKHMLLYRAHCTTVKGKVSGSIGVLIDISERRRIEADLQIEKDRAVTTLDSIGDAVFSTDQHGRILTMNSVAEQLSGWSRSEALGQPLQQILKLREQADQAALNHLIESGGILQPVQQASNQILCQRNGRQIDIDYTASSILQADGSSSGCVLVCRDLSEKRQLMRQISWQAGHDVLTGLPNRSALNTHFSQAIAHADHQQQWLAVCLLDLDHFQMVNDKHGRDNAEKVLQQLARRLEQNAGRAGLAARLGGDEFVVLLHNPNDVQVLQQQLQQLLQDIANQYLIEQKAINLTASIGVAIYPRDEQSPDALLRFADQAMYQAKISGRNKFHLFDIEQDREVRTHHNQRARIRRALHDNEFRMYLQPKVNMRTRQITGMEALLRWQHPDNGLTGPMQFLPLVEHTELIVDIGEWVLHQALAQLQHWAALDLPWSISVNIAARHFQDRDFSGSLRAILQQYPDVDPGRLELEILESATLADIGQVRELMLDCQAQGVGFALDDFGTGYSSLSYLKRLPAQTLKIDQSFVRDVLDDADDRALISAIIGLARAFRREVIAEGVETAAHGAALMRLGCDLAQGYGIARPMPAEQVEAWAATYQFPPIWAGASESGHQQVLFPSPSLPVELSPA